MEVSEKRQDTVCILSLSGRLDANSSEEFQEKLVQIIEGGTNNLVLDCQNLDRTRA